MSTILRSCAPCARVLARRVPLHMRCISSVVTDDDLRVPEFQVKNEPILGYLNGSKERQELETALKAQWDRIEDIPVVIGGKRLKTGEQLEVRCPFDHSKVLAKFYRADAAHLSKAISAALAARKGWEATPLKDRVEIFLRVGDLCAGKYRQELNAATILGQAKTFFQAEIDSACELTDFFRFNAFYAKELANGWQPLSLNAQETRNSMRFRGLEGFIAGISPFNFTAIGGNLGATPAIMGNAILWKPSDAAVLSNWVIFKVLEEAGVPPGVVNFVPADGPLFGKIVTTSPHLAAINFTGSVATWRWLVRAVGENIDKYANYPRLMGECGGKNYHLIHPSADLETAVAATLRSAFEFGGQKCSACSRLYVPQSVWPKFQEMMMNKIKQVTVGDPRDPKTFYSAVIDQAAFKRINSYIDYAKTKHKVLVGGVVDNSRGYFVQPTVVQVDDPNDKMLNEEIFGPVLSVLPFPDAMLKADIFDVIQKVPFGLTGAVFAQDEEFLKLALRALKDTAGNFYINDKSTGAVVGQQPFGGTRISGTNDKPGGLHYMLRWVTPQSIKETFVPLKDLDYPYMRD